MKVVRLIGLLIVATNVEKGRELETAVVDWIGSLIDPRQENKERARGVLHTTAQEREFPSRTFTFCRELGTVNSCGFHEQDSRHVPDSD